MRPPAFWFRDPARPGWQARILAPLGAVYAALTRRRVARAPLCRPSCPVICVGNLNAGGTGKTPVVIALTSELQARGLDVAIISRGYGGRLAGPLRVDPVRHTAADTGDEPLLLAAFAPTFIGRDRAAAATLAASSGAGIIIMDDGHQNPEPARDMSLVVVDAGIGFGNGRVLPAGPLREPVAAGLARADAVIAVGTAEECAAFRRDWADKLGLPVVDANTAPLATGIDWNGLRGLAFAGIGRPEKFFSSLRAAGAEIVRAVPLDDHQPLTLALLSRLSTDAARLGAQLVTTEKDAVRLPDRYRQEVLTMPVRLEFADPAALTGLLDKLQSGT